MSRVWAVVACAPFGALAAVNRAMDARRQRREQKRVDQQEQVILDIATGHWMKEGKHG